MPRTSSTPSRSTHSKSLTVPRAAQSTPQYIPSTPSFGQTLKEGFALGTGSAIAHRVVSSVLGAPTVTMNSPSEKKIESPCEKERVAFESCMKFKSADDFCGNEQLGYTACLRNSKA
jgi:hypothetical protein